MNSDLSRLCFLYIFYLYFEIAHLVVKSLICSKGKISALFSIELKQDAHILQQLFNRLLARIGEVNKAPAESSLSAFLLQLRFYVLAFYLYAIRVVICFYLYLLVFVRYRLCLHLLATLNPMLLRYSF